MEHNTALPCRVSVSCDHKISIETNSDIVCTECGLVLEPVFSPQGENSEPEGQRKEDTCFPFLRNIMREFVEKQHLPQRILFEAYHLLETKRVKQNLCKHEELFGYTRRNLSVLAYILHASLHNQDFDGSLSLQEIMALLRPWPQFSFLTKGILDKELRVLKKEKNYKPPSHFIDLLLERLQLSHIVRHDEESRNLLKRMAHLCDAIARDSNTSPLALMASTLQGCLSPDQKKLLPGTTGCSQSTLYRARKSVQTSRQGKEVTCLSQRLQKAFKRQKKGNTCL